MKRIDMITFPRDMDVTITKIESLYQLNGKRVAIFSGSFNPPHLGHLATIQAVLGKYVDHVLICPHSFNAGKHTILVGIDHRLNMLKLLIAEMIDRGKVFILSNNVIQGLWNNDSIQILKDLEKNGIEIFILTGMDTVDEKYYSDLTYFRHLIAKRKWRYSHKKIRNVIHNEFQVFDRKYSKHSSTKIRHNLNKKTVGINSVYQYILQNGLYSND
jgi:cytidyltransferase-like protein